MCTVTPEHIGSGTDKLVCVQLNLNKFDQLE